MATPNGNGDKTVDVERSNLAQVEMLNQRGGRTLSIVDLVDAGTLSPDMAALCRLLVEGGESFLAGSVPGGAGKTTLMAAVLGFLPAGERIVTAADADTVSRAAGGAIATPFCLLAHEIGQGRWYGYIWGRVAQEFFSLGGAGARRVSCLHADTPEQTDDILARCGVRHEDIERVGFQMFIGEIGRASCRERV